MNLRDEIEKLVAEFKDKPYVSPSYCARRLESLLSEAEPQEQYCECDGHWSYSMALEALLDKRPCAICSKTSPHYRNPLWTWHPGDPTPNTVPKGCVDLWEAAGKDVKTSPTHMVHPSEWDEIPRRWPILDNPDVYDEPQEQEPERKVYPLEWNSGVPGCRQYGGLFLPYDEEWNGHDGYTRLGFLIPGWGDDALTMPHWVSNEGVFADRIVFVRVKQEGE